MSLDVRTPAPGKDPQGPAARGDTPGSAEPASQTAAARGARSWTVLELLQWTSKHFAERGIDTARLDAECLLAHALGVERLRLYLDFEKPVSPDERATFRELVRRRAGERVPVAQLLGRKEFWSLSLRVTPDVLVPRPDTETLVQAALDLLPADRETRVLEVGTGSGAVALALASERPLARITATDVCPKALEVARRNADELLVDDTRNADALPASERIRWLEGSLYEPVAGERFDLVVSNPPYVAEDHRSQLAPELAHEPELALFGGPDGLDCLRTLVLEAASVLAPGGGLALEVSPEQVAQVSDWTREVGLLEVSVRRDLADRERVLCARLRAGGGD